MAEQLTEEQRKEFWEKHGFYQSGHKSIGWCTPDGKICDHIGLVFPPPIDLPNLFTYAVPDNCSVRFISRTVGKEKYTRCDLVIDEGKYGYGTKSYTAVVKGIRQYAPALFRVLRQAKEAKQ